MRADRSRLPEPGPDPVFHFPSRVRYELPNGLTVLTVEHDGVPVVMFAMSVEGGLSADPGGKEGLAALTADLVDEGTGDLSAIDVSDAMVRIGAEYDVEVGADSSTFTMMMLARYADRGGALLSRILTAPALREPDFLRVRQLRLDRLRQLKDLPPAVAERAFLRLLYREHPYGHMAIGTDGSLSALTLADAAAFHASTYAPSQSTLVVTGAMPHVDLAALAKDTFGAWRPARGVDVASSVVADPAPGPIASSRVAIVPREGAAQSELRIGHLAARRDTPDYLPLVVMNAVLGGQFVSRLNLKLREEKAFTYGARTGFDWRRGLGPFALQASVHTAATAEAIRDCLSEFAGIRGERPATEHELALAKASLTRGFPRHFETAQQLSRAVVQLTLFGLPETYFDEFVPRVNAVTIDDVTRVAQAYLGPDRTTVLVVGDRAVVEPSLRELGLGEVEVLSQDG